MTTTMSAPSPELTLKHLDALPTLDPIAVRLLAVAADEDSSARDLVRILRADQALTARILTAASSVGGAARPIRTLDQAVPLLGFSAIRSLVLAVKVFGCFPDAGREGAGFDRREFWKHALAVACAARGIAAARTQLNVDPEEAFVAGLLHDLGKVALDAVFPKAYDRVARQSDELRGDISDAERELLGIDHTVAGRKLAERWGLPKGFAEAIWLHHLSTDALPASVSAGSLVAVTRLADTIAREQRIGYSGNYQFYDSSEDLAAQLGVSDAAYQKIVTTLAPAVATQCELLGIDRDTSDELYVKSLRNANTELAELNQRLERHNRQLAAGARYFRAMTEFDRRLSDSSDVGHVVAAMTAATQIATQRQRLVAFALHEDGNGVEIGWMDTESGDEGVSTELMSAELREWTQRGRDVLDLLIAPAPYAVRELVAPWFGEGEARGVWMLPVGREGAVKGGIVYMADDDERSRYAGEMDELRAYLTSIGLVIGRAHAHARARRLSDELAETNRRLQQTQASLLQQRSLSMIASMASGAGHELNTPLTVISGRAQLLGAKTTDPDAKKALDLIRDKAHECSLIVSELMQFATPRTPRVEPIDPAQLVDDVARRWREKISDGARRLRVQRPREELGDLRLLVDPAQTRDVLDELVSNAINAVRDNDGVITLTWRAAHPHPARGDKPDALSKIEILVQDTGAGMKPDVLRRAFDPFFSHQAAGRNRGMGLATSHRIVEIHGGRIWLESQVGRGTVAHVALPATRS